MVVVTVSGLAYGVDKLAHEISVKNGGKTVGVIGSGLDQKSFYPKQNWHLKNEILELGGLVLSEYAPSVKATKFSFPKRNRIIAALSNTTFIVQANIKSGSLITARIANDLGKNVVTVPARVNDAYFDGNLKLLQEGAQLILSSEDLASILGVGMIDSLTANNFKNMQTLKTQNENLKFDSEEEKVIYLELQKNEQTLDNLVIKTGLDFGVLSEKLLLLELAGKIVNENDIWRIT